MKIKVNRRQIPVEFGNLKYTYDLTLETRERLETAKGLLKDLTEDKDSVCFRYYFCNIQDLNA